MTIERAHETRRVLDIPIDRCSPASLTATVDHWARAGESRTICFANTHVVTTACRDAELRAALEAADIVAPDGFPIAWALRRLGCSEQLRVDGPSWMLHWCEHAAEHGLPIYLYGSTPETLAKLECNLRATFPTLHIAGSCSPPFRPLTEDERAARVAAIRRSGARVVFVGLGAPRQEQWMLDVRDELPVVLAGVGAAFDFHAGVMERAPVWMQRSGLEWVHRLLSEPRRLWRRYLVCNVRFAVGFGAQLLTRP